MIVYVHDKTTVIADQPVTSESSNILVIMQVVTAVASIPPTCCWTTCKRRMLMLYAPRSLVCLSALLSVAPLLARDTTHVRRCAHGAAGTCSMEALEPNSQPQPSSSSEQQPPSSLWNDPPAIQQHISSDPAAVRTPKRRSKIPIIRIVAATTGSFGAATPTSRSTNLVFIRCHAGRRLLSAKNGNSSSAEQPPQLVSIKCRLSG